jgi:hypothetical protein
MDNKNEVADWHAVCGGSVWWVCVPDPDRLGLQPRPLPVHFVTPCRL